MHEMIEPNQKLLPSNSVERRKIISAEAASLAHTKGLIAKSDFDIWLEAERRIDRKIFNQDLQPHEFYGSVMAKFFIEQPAKPSTDPETLAKAYLHYVLRNESLFQKISQYKMESGFWSVALLSQNTSLSFLTKRSILLSDTTLLGHAHKPETVFDIAYDAGSGKLIYQDTHYLSNCPDLSELSAWLMACQPLLERGETFYYPKTAVRSHSEDWSPNGDLDESIIKTDHLFDAIISSKKIVETGQLDPHLKTLIRTITSLKIPVVDNVSIENFSKITCDEHVSFEVFRDFLRQNFLDLIENEGDERFDGNLQRIGLNINAGVRKISSDLKRLQKKAAIRSVGATLGFVAATLIAIDARFYSHIVPLLGTVGGLTTFLSLIENHQDELSKLKSEHFYYLWLLENKA